MIDEIALARENRKGRDIEREMDAAGIRSALVAGVPHKEHKLLREFKAAAQSFVDEIDEEEEDVNRDYMDYPSSCVLRHVEWFRELLK